MAAAAAAGPIEITLDEKEHILKELIGQALCQTIIDDTTISVENIEINDRNVKLNANGQPYTIGILFCELLERLATPLLTTVPEGRLRITIIDRLKLILGKIVNPNKYTVNSIMSNFCAIFFR